MGWALIISSVSIDIRLRNFKLVGVKNTSPREIVGNSSGKPPPRSTPLFIASSNSGKCLWQLLNPEKVFAIPTIGFFKTSFEYPIDKAKDRLK